MVGKLRADVQTGRHQLECYRRRAGDLYSRAVDDRLMSQSSHRYEGLTWDLRVKDVE